MNSIHLDDFGQPMDEDGNSLDTGFLDWKPVDEAPCYQDLVLMCKDGSVLVNAVKEWDGKWFWKGKLIYEEDQLVWRIK